MIVIGVHKQEAENKLSGGGNE